MESGKVRSGQVERGTSLEWLCMMVVVLCAGCCTSR